MRPFLLLVFLFFAPACFVARAGADVLSEGIGVWDYSLLGYSLVLYYYPNLPTQVEKGLELGVPEGNATQVLAWQPVTVGQGDQLSSTSLANPTNPLFNSHPLVTTTKDLVFVGCWGLRGYTFDRAARVSISFPGGASSQLLTNAGSASVVLAKDPFVRTGAMQGPSITVPVSAYPVWPYGPTPVIGDVGMRLDLSGLTRAGLHTGGRFTLTAELY